MKAEAILDRFSDEEVRELERYYLGTISGCPVCHEPLVVARLLLGLSLDERRCLADWAFKNFANLSPSLRVAA